MSLERKIIDYNQNKDDILHWVNLKGEYRYLEIIQFLSEQNIEPTWANVTRYIKYDKRILINAFKYIIFLEELYKSFIMKYKEFNQGDLLRFEFKRSLDEISKEISEEKEDKIELSREILDKESMKKLEEEKNKLSDPTDDLMKDLDKSFYTKSMDLSDKDFDFGDEYENDKKIPIIVKILLILILIAIVLVGVYFIIQKVK